MFPSNWNFYFLKYYIRKSYLNCIFISRRFIWNFVYRLAEEGYKSPEDGPPVDTMSDSVPVIETMTLKELTEKTSSEYIKVF